MSTGLLEILKRLDANLGKRKSRESETTTSEPRMNQEEYTIQVTDSSNLQKGMLIMWIQRKDDNIKKNIVPISAMQTITHNGNRIKLLWVKVDNLFHQITPSEQELYTTNSPIIINDYPHFNAFRDAVYKHVIDKGYHPSQRSFLP